MMTAIINPPHNSPSSNFYKSNKITTDSMTLIPITHDTTDKPVLRKFVLEEDETEKNIFEEMKCESNRLHTFKDRWPAVGVTPESLAEAGFFYLQQEDKVQCPFCHIVISNWTPDDKPLREHMRNKPKCPFLLGLDVGNISMFNEKPKGISLSSISQNTHSNSVTASYKPKHSRMADIKRRILTFSGWPLSKPEPRQLAECGLYYSGIGDVVTCFFCGGTLGNWEPEDDPWHEHLKFFPDCSFLAISKNKHSRLTKIQAPEEKLVNKEIPLAYKLASTEITRDVIKQALDIFPESLVVNALKNKSGIISSLQELCDDILELEQSSLPRVPKVSTRMESQCENVSTSQDTLLCKVCMDRERGVVFQPCGHLVSCWNCSNLISDCPVCRSPIRYKIRTYLS